MRVTLEGMTTSDRELQSENALLPMLVTLEGMTISERELRPQNASLHIILVPSLIE